MAAAALIKLNHLILKIPVSFSDTVGTNRRLSAHFSGQPDAGNFSEIAVQTLLHDTAVIKAVSAQTFMAVDPPVSGQAENMSEFVHDHGFEPFYVCLLYTSDAADEL